MTKYEFTGFSEFYGALVQGGVQAIVYGPAGQEQRAGELARLMARGATRREAGAAMATNGEPVRGFRVIDARLVA